MLLTKFRPDFECNADGLVVSFTSAPSRLLLIFSGSTHKAAVADDGVADTPIKHALAFESNFLRLTGPLSPLMSGDVRDTTKSSHTTGGGRRSFVSIPLTRDLRGKPDGRSALLSWAQDQGNRPVCWLPFTFTYDGFYGRLNNGTDTWKYDQQDAAGWSIFDPAHLESTPLFAGAAKGIDVSLAHFAMLLAWVSKTYYNAATGQVQKVWNGSGQPRAVGWSLLFFARACMLGFDTCDDEFKETFLGERPKKILVALVKDLLANPIPIGGDRPDDRTMVDFKDGSGEIKGALGFQEAILLYGIGYLLRTGLINDPLKSELKAWIDDRAAIVMHDALGPTGLTYAFSRKRDFTQADCDKANLMETDKSHVYELVPTGSVMTSGGAVGAIRDIPRKPDAELMLGGLAMMYGPTCPEAAALASLLPKPSQIAAYDDLARYADVYHGLLD